MPFRSDLKTPAKDRSDDRRPRGRPSAVACAGSTLHKKPGQPNDRWMVNLASSSAYSRGSLGTVVPKAVATGYWLGGGSQWGIGYAGGGSVFSTAALAAVGLVAMGDRVCRGWKNFCDRCRRSCPVFTVNTLGPGRSPFARHIPERSFPDRLGRSCLHKLLGYAARPGSATMPA